MPLVSYVYPDDHAAMLHNLSVSRKAIPQYLVECRDCLYFEKDLIGSGQGAGHCSIHGEGVNYNQRSLYPSVKRVCSQFLSRVRLTGTNHHDE